MRGFARRHVAVACGVAIAVLPVAAVHVDAGKPVTRVVYDDFSAAGYALENYLAKWNNAFGPEEMAVEYTRSFDDSSFSVSALPFRTAADFSVVDHITYLALSNQSSACQPKGRSRSRPRSTPRSLARRLTVE